LIDRVVNATSPYAYETALKRMDEKIAELKHAYALDQMRTQRSETGRLSAQRENTRWQSAIESLSTIRHQIAANFDLKHPSKWQRPELDQLCRELVSTGPQLCADLLTQTLTSREGIASSLRANELPPALKLMLSDLPGVQTFTSFSPSALASWESSLGPVDAQIGAIGRRLTAYRNYLTTQTNTASPRLLEDYDEAIARLATLKVLLTMKTTEDFQKSPLAQSQPEIAKAWSENLKRKLDQIQAATGQLLNSPANLKITLASHESVFLPTIANGDGTTRVGLSVGSQNISFVGENLNEIESELSLASAWRKLRESPHADADHFDQLVTGINFLKSLAIE
jgi:hypothetical protein